jgi:hypothetical protein
MHLVRDRKKNKDASKRNQDTGLGSIIGRDAVEHRANAITATATHPKTGVPYPVDSDDDDSLSFTPRKPKAKGKASQNTLTTIIQPAQHLTMIVYSWTEFCTFSDHEAWKPNTWEKDISRAPLGPSMPSSTRSTMGLLCPAHNFVSWA